MEILTEKLRLLRGKIVLALKERPADSWPQHGCIMPTEITDRPKEIILDEKSPASIYVAIIDGVRQAVSAIGDCAEEEVEEVDQQIIEDLGRIQAYVTEKQGELQSVAEWKDFTIALYGETNAGKSTIIETLRILLGEPAKLEQRRKFQALSSKFGLADADLHALQAQIENARSAGAAASALHRERIAAFAILMAELQTQKAAAESKAVEAWNARSWWQKLWEILQRQAFDTDARAIDARILAEGARHQAEADALATEARSAQDVVSRTTVDLERRLNVLPQLLEDADGGIIGDGRPDFTRFSQRYEFHVDGVRFTLLDVPGIEGREGAVNSHINTAVQAAHAVFYVTGKAARPQHGDNEEGTLEKIKRHLGVQTEVWAVFNKRIAAPLPLRNPGNLFAKDDTGLLDLDNGLREELGGHYQGILPVSAYPAFLAVADHLPPAAALAETATASAARIAARAKFLSEFDASSLLEKTGFSALARHLLDMAQNAPLKIRRANVHKAHQVLKDVVAEVDLHRSRMEKFAREVKAEVTKAQAQIDKAAEQFSASLRADAGDALRSFESRARRKMYAQIESGIGNSDLKQALAACIDIHAEELKDEVGQAFQASVSRFQLAVTKATEFLHKHLSDLDKIASNQVHEVSRVNLELNLRISNGVNIGALVGGVLTIAVSWIFPPAGVTATILFVVTALVDIAKGFWGLIDSDYRKSQQRKAVDENLSTAIGKLRENLHAGEEYVLRPVKDAVEKAKKHLRQPRRSVEAKAAALSASATRLRALSVQIEAIMD